MSIAQGGRLGRTLIVAVRFWFSLVCLAMVNTAAHAEALNELVTAEYYIDSLPGLGGGHLIAIDQTEQFNLAYLIEKIHAPDLDIGVHNIALRFQNQDGDWSVAIHQSFYWPGYNGPIGDNSHLNPIIKGEAFINDQDMLEGTGIEIVLAADGNLDTNFERLQRIAGIRGLNTGQHSVSIKLLDSSGIWSAPVTQSFYVYQNQLSSDSAGDGEILPDDTYAGNNDQNGWFFPSRINHVNQAIAYYDDDFTNSIAINLPSEQDIATGSALNYFNSPATTTDLTPGVHSFHLSFQDNTGQWSQPVVQSVLINPTHLVSIGQSANRIQAARFSLDDENPVNLTAGDGAFDDVVESIEHSQAVTQNYHNVTVNFLDLSEQWSDPLNNVTQPIENDIDGNGISDQWELTWFGVVGIDPNADYDNDGISNLDEFLLGKHPLVPDNQTAVTISGYVKDAQGDAIPHVLVCVDGDENCPVRTDAYGHYILGLTEEFSAAEHTVLVKSTSASGLMAFSPAQVVNLANGSVERVNFSSTDIQLSWSFVANQQYNPGDNLELQWQSNLVNHLGVTVGLKRASVAESQSEPDNLNWYQFDTFDQNDPITITIPEGLNFAGDWTVVLSLVGADEPVLNSATFELLAVTEPVPVVEINMTSLANPIEGELITAKFINLDETHVLTNSHWSAVRLSAGLETGERILLNEENTLRTEQLGAGDWRIFLQVKNDAGQWSEPVSQDLYVTAIEGLADLAISQTSIQVVNQQGQNTHTVEQGEMVTVQVKVANAGTIELPDIAKVIVRDGIGEGSTTLGTIEIENLAAGAETTVNVPISASNATGYQTITVDVQFAGNIGVDLEQPTVAESNRFNNAASIFLIVGNPPAGSFGIDLVTPEVFTAYPGQSTLIYGQAQYSFGARMPLMGTQVFIDLEQQQLTGRTTSPVGNFAVRAQAPLDLGDHLVNVTVNGGYMQPARKSVILRVIPWPTIEQWFPATGTYSPPPIPAPITDLRLKRVTLSSDGYYITDNGVQALVQNTEASVQATIHNSGNLPVDSGFKVAFYYADDSSPSGFQAVGDSVVVHQSLAVGQYMQVSSLQTISFEQLGYRQVFAEIFEVVNESIPDNNKNSISFEVRANRPDLRNNSQSPMRFSNKKPIPGESVRIFADVYNRGPAQLNDTFTVHFYDGAPADGELIDSATFSGVLDKGQTTTLAINWTASAEGHHTIYAVIDANNMVDEDAENNNLIMGSLNVIPDIADLFVGLNLSDYSVNPGTNISLNGSITNSGTQPSEPSNVTFYLGDPNSAGEVISSVAIAQLLSKTSTPVSVEWNTLIPHGNHKICLVIESNGRKACKTLHISDSPVPDLQIYSEDISYVPGPYPMVDDQVLVSANIRNVSAYRNATNITVQFYGDSPAGFFQIGESVQIDEIALQSSLAVTATQTFTIDQPYYALQVNVIPNSNEGEANLADNAATTAFAVDGFPTDIIDAPEGLSIQLNDVKDAEGVDVYDFSVTLSEPLPQGYGVFLNFDNEQGEWFAMSDEGGHLAVTSQSGNIYSLTYEMQKPGLRSFRAGIFDLQDIADPSDDILVVGYTDYKTCTLDSCKDSVDGLVVNSVYGNPAISGSGSQLFKNVDVASGNYHLSATDIATSGKGPSFAMTRAYNSLSDASQHWNFAYEMTAQLAGEFNRRIIIGPREDGRLQHYFKDMDQKWYALNPGNFDQLVEQEDGSLTLYTKGNRLYLFAKPNSETPGLLQTIEDRLGNALTMGYANNLLVEVTDANGNTTSITRDVNNRIKRVTDFTNRYVEYGYNNNGMLSSVRDVNGNLSFYTYADGEATKHLLIAATDPRNKQQFLLTYDVNQKVSSLTEGDSSVTQLFTQFVHQTNDEVNYSFVHQHNADAVTSRGYVIDQTGLRILETISPENFDDYQAQNSYAAVKQHYQNIKSRLRLAELALVSSKADEKGQVTRLDYSDDGKGNVLQVTNALENTTSATYAGESSLTEQTNLTPVTSVKKPSEDTQNIIIEYRDHTLTGKPETVIDPRGAISRFAYGVSNIANNEWLNKLTNARGFATQFNEYDANGNAKTIVDAKGNVTRNEFDVLSRLIKVVSPLGLTTTHTYDVQGNITTTTQSASGGINYTSQYFYDASNNLTKMIDPLGHQTNYVYDSLNRKIEENFEVSGETYTRKFTYDALGRLYQTTNARGESSTTHFTKNSQVHYKVNPLAEQVLTYTYDKNGNVITVTDGEYRTTTTTYDELNRKVLVVDDEGNQQHWKYNKAGHIESYKDSRNQTTYYEYDSAGNLIKLTDANGGVTESTYDANNNLTKVIGPNGSVTQYSYDELDRRTSTSIINGTNAQIWNFEYDANGNLLTETKPTGERIVKVYDAINRVTQLTEYNADSSITRDIAYEYDANNNVLKQKNGGNEITYSYDAINRVTSVTDQFGQTLAYGYDKAGNRTELIYPGNKTVTYSFDQADRLTGLTDWLNNTTTYALNKSGQIKQINNANGTSVNYQYDAAGRLTLLENLSADNTVISRHQLTLDGAGNITQTTGDLPLAPELPVSFNAQYDASNRIVSAGNRSFEHDQSGRIVEHTQASDEEAATTTTYHFDINDQLTTITENGQLKSLYGYDVNNNRISQQQLTATDNNETRYVIDQLANLPNVVAETDDQGVISHYYVYGHGLVSKIDAQNNSHYYHYDPTGHTLALTDENGSVTDKYAYTPYGKTTIDGTSHNPFLFVGKHGVMDDGNGLHFMRARYYKQDIKRFISLDVLHGEMLTPQSLNRYAYVLGNPIMGIDPSGFITLKQFARNYKYNLISLGKHIGNDVKDTAVVAGRIGKDTWDVYVYEPADEIVNDCRSNNEGLILKLTNCTGSAFSNAAGAGLDVINPTTAIKASLREPIRIIASGDEEFEKELIAVADTVFALWSIRKAARQISHASNSAAGAKKAIETIKLKIKSGKSGRGLAANQSNYNHHVTRYLGKLTDLIKAYESGIKLNSF